MLSNLEKEINNGRVLQVGDICKYKDNRYEVTELFEDGFEGTRITNGALTTDNRDFYFGKLLAEFAFADGE